MTRASRRHLSPLPAGMRTRRSEHRQSVEIPAEIRVPAHDGGYAHTVSQDTTDGDRDSGVLSFAVIDAYTDIVLRTGTEREWRHSREAAERDGEPGIIDDFDGRAVYVEDWRS